MDTGGGHGALVLRATSRRRPSPAENEQHFLEAYQQRQGPTGGGTSSPPAAEDAARDKLQTYEDGQSSECEYMYVLSSRRLQNSNRSTPALGGKRRSQKTC